MREPGDRTEVRRTRIGLGRGMGQEGNATAAEWDQSATDRERTGPEGSERGLASPGMGPERFGHWADRAGRWDQRGSDWSGGSDSRRKVWGHGMETEPRLGVRPVTRLGRAFAWCLFKS